MLDKVTPALAQLRAEFHGKPIAERTSMMTGRLRQLGMPTTILAAEMIEGLAGERTSSASVAITPEEQRQINWWLGTEYAPNITGVSMSRDLLRRLVASYDAEAKEAHEIGRREGYEEAVADIDRLTGGDGEYVFSTVPGEGCPDPETMKARIEERFALPTKKP